MDVSPAKIIPIAKYLGELLGVDFVGEGPVRPTKVLTNMLREYSERVYLGDGEPGKKRKKRRSRR